MELFTPRLGFPGLIGIAAFLLFFYGHIMAGYAGVLSLICFAAGIILILLEFGIAGRSHWNHWVWCFSSQLFHRRRELCSHGLLLIDCIYSFHFGYDIHDKGV